MTGQNPVLLVLGERSQYLITREHEKAEIHQESKRFRGVHSKRREWECRVRVTLETDEEVATAAKSVAELQRDGAPFPADPVSM